MSIDLSALSTEQLEKALAQKREEENKAKQAKRKEYEQNREDLICGLGMMAYAVQKKIEELKKVAFGELSSFRSQMLEYGELKGGQRNKGSFSLQNERYKIEFKTQMRKAFDERAELAESKLREFLNTFLKKKAHKDVVAIINALLERNTKTNDYDINLINRLYSMEDRFDDANWRDAIKLFKESYSPAGTAQYVRFWIKNDASNAWESVCLDIASAKIKD